MIMFVIQNNFRRRTSRLKQQTSRSRLSMLEDHLMARQCLNSNSTKFQHLKFFSWWQVLEMSVVQVQVEKYEDK